MSMKAPFSRFQSQRRLKSLSKLAGKFHKVNRPAMLFFRLTRKKKTSHSTVFYSFESFTADPGRLMVCSSSSDIQGRLRKYPFTEIGTFKTFIPELEPLLPSSNYGVKTQHLRITSALLKCLR